MSLRESSWAKAGTILAARAVVTERDHRVGASNPVSNREALRQETSPDVALEALARALPERLNADPDQVENGLARLVLTVIELLREILEHQAIRRMDGGTLTDEQVERLGLALLKLNERMEELKKTFGLTDEDLNIDLGPLGRLR
jgi:hypothetical protein